MNTAKRSRLRALTPIVLFLCAAPAGPCEAQDAPPRLIAQYDLGPTLVETELVTVTLRLRLFNPGTDTLQGLELRLGDSLLLGETLATFDGLTIAPHGMLDLERRVVLPAREYELWIRGGRPKLYLMVLDAGGILRPQRIELWHERIDPAPAAAGVGASGLLDIQQAQPGGEERP